MTLEHPTPQRPSSPLSNPRHPKTRWRSDLIVAAFKSAMSERWGTFKTRRNHTIIDIVEALAGLKTFADGGRAAYPAEKLAQRCHKHVRTVEEAVAKLREFPELVHVVLVRKGEIDWRGATSRRAHLEFQVGSVLGGLLEHPVATGAVSMAPGVTAGPHRCDAGNTPGLTPADLNLAQSSDLELQLKREPVRNTRTDQLNFEVQLSGQVQTPPTDTECPPHPTIHPTTAHAEAASPCPSPIAELPPVPHHPVAALAEARTEPPTLLRPQLAPLRTGGPAPLSGRRSAPALTPTSRGSERCRRRPGPLVPLAAPAPDEQPLKLRFPYWLLDSIIRQHRVIAEGKGPYVPIDNRERARVDGALGGLPGSWEDDALLALCARVSDSAVRDARAKGGTVANLRYTFGGPDEEPEEPHKHFHRRVAGLREDDEKCARERLDGELTAALLGTPKPPVTPRAAGLARPKRLMPGSRGAQAERRSDRVEPRLTQAEIEACISLARAQMEKPYVAWAG
jgi:hypothetical protein